MDAAKLKKKNKAKQKQKKWTRINFSGTHPITSCLERNWGIWNIPTASNVFEALPCTSFHGVSSHPARWVGLRQALLISPTRDGAQIQKASDLPTPLHDPNRPQAALGSPTFCPGHCGNVWEPWWYREARTWSISEGKGEILFPQWQWGMPGLGLGSGKGVPTSGATGTTLHPSLASSESLLWDVRLNSFSLNSSPLFLYKENGTVARPWAVALDQPGFKSFSGSLATWPWTISSAQLPVCSKTRGYFERVVGRIKLNSITQVSHMSSFPLTFPLW